MSAVLFIVFIILLLIVLNYDDLKKECFVEFQPEKDILNPRYEPYYHRPEMVVRPTPSKMGDPALKMDHPLPETW